ncbi:MAG TPA: polysaccharide deacetylase family protein [Rhizomicrobium sp.]
MKVSLTFDNGPTTEVTPHVLEVLARRGIAATFFTLGRNLVVPEQRKLTERARAEGHRIGNHSYNHATPFGELANPADAELEILATDALLGDLVGEERLFRPFGRAELGRHLLNPRAWNLLAARGFTCVLWTTVAYENRRPDSWMEPVALACEERDWSVVVLHDIPTGAMRNLDRFLDLLAERGAEFSQDFPAGCTPLRRGIELGSHAHLMQPAASLGAG